MKTALSLTLITPPPQQSCVQFVKCLFKKKKITQEVVFSPWKLRHPEKSSAHAVLSWIVYNSANEEARQVIYK